jgi:hypothetical protein
MTNHWQSLIPPDVRTAGAEYLPRSVLPTDYRDSAVERWRTALLILAGVLGLAAIAWFVLFAPGESGSKAQWFFGAVVLVAVLVSMWQTHVVLAQVRRETSEAVERLRKEVAAAEERTARELTLARQVHEAELSAQREVARSELTAQTEHARVERALLLAQQQRLAMVGVSRAVNTSTQALAALWNQAATVLDLPDPQARQQAMHPLFEQIAQQVNEFSVELANAHLLVEDERLHQALDDVNEAVLMALQIAEDVHSAVVDGREPDAAAVTSAQRLMHSKAARARELAWRLLRSGIEMPPANGQVDRVPRGAEAATDRDATAASDADGTSTGAEDTAADRATNGSGAPDGATATASGDAKRTLPVGPLPIIGKVPGR